MQIVRIVVCLVVVVLTLAASVQADTFGTGVNQFTIDFVPISGSSNPTSGYGIVNNDYRMGTFEITNNQWTKFVNSYGMPIGDPSDAYDHESKFTGVNVPTDCVSWYEAAQFVNWLNTSTGHQAAYKFTGTQGTANYTMTTWVSTDTGYNVSNPYRNSDAFY
ncbi:MAG TPA: SUMF1/EgtB/PvdO family nonheme iron enzyme, partial [Sedimentisphaerales bacterium]|nr:SUMF1/EgtB/PvdO family nonheme iron enzyme [Sedimentisphaerales bacterium]